MMRLLLAVLSVGVGRSTISKTSVATEIEDVKYEAALLEKQLEFAKLQLAESRLRHESRMRQAAIYRAKELTGTAAKSHAAGRTGAPPPRVALGESLTEDPSEVGRRRRIKRRMDRPESTSGARESRSVDVPTTAAPPKRNRPKVTIVVWNKIQGYLDWLRSDFTSAARSKCSTECVFTADKSKVHEADGVVFHAKTHSARDFPRPRAKGKYIIASLEQERYAPLLKQPNYVAKFDATATFKLDSTLPMITIPPHWDADAYYRAYERAPRWEDRSDAAVAFVSNCRNAGAADRLDFITKLSKVYEVHSYGRCLHNRDEPPLKPGQSRADLKRHILSKYKFYLALENNVDALDYVSEKVHDGILAGVLPIYRGTPSVDKLIPAPEAVLKTSDFGDDARKLANHLRHLAANSTAYDAHFRWRRHPSPQAIRSFQDVLDMTAYKYTALCRICAYAHGDYGGSTGGNNS